MTFCNLAELDIFLHKCRFLPYSVLVAKEQESKLKDLGIFNLATAEEIGISHQKLSRWVQQEKVLRMGRGIYFHSDSNIEREIDFQVACQKFGPSSAIGGLSALFYYHLIEQVPEQTWVLVPPPKKSSEKGYRLLRTKTRLDQGIVQGNGYRIVSIERAILEGLRLASKIGERTALKAVRQAIAQNLTNLNQIGAMAKELKLDSYLTKYFEAIVA